MITLYEMLGIKEGNFCEYKVHFATGSKDKKKPYKAFLVGEFKEWQERQTKKNFKRKYILSLIYYEKDVWLFGGVYQVLPVKPIPIQEDSGWKGWKYETSLTARAEEYIGKAFFRFKKEFRVSYPVLELKTKMGSEVAKMPVAYLLENRVAITDFLGFDQVNVDYKTLKYIVSE